MWDDEGEVLRLEFEKHNDWTKLGTFAAKRRVASFNAGFNSGKHNRETTVKQIEKLITSLQTL